VRFLNDAMGDRQLPPSNTCYSIYIHEWEEYGEYRQMTVFKDNSWVNEDVKFVYLILCKKCHKTPEEVTRPV
jgi:hypothetical protein